MDASSYGDCSKHIPGFVGLGMLKRSAELCKILPPIGNFVCKSDDHINDIDKKALCTLICCCNTATNKKQDCVTRILWQAERENRLVPYKAEVPYIDKAPQMSNTEPWRNTHGKPAGSRIPDVVVVKDPMRPPTLDNLQKVYEIKFPPDKYDNTRKGPDNMTQHEAYNNSFGDKLNKEPLDPKNCGCDNENRKRENVSVLEKAVEWNKENTKNVDVAEFIGLLPVSRVPMGAINAVKWISRIILTRGLAF